jgi:hypothetical protein
MQDLLTARAHMNMSLGFHIVFDCAGVGTPLLRAIADSYPGTTEGFPLLSLPGVRCARTCPPDLRLL